MTATMTAAERNGPRCPTCGEPDNIMFLDGPHVHEASRYCSVCDGQQTTDIVVLATVVITTGTVTQAEEAVVDALQGVGRLTNVEGHVRGE